MKNKLFLNKFFLFLSDFSLTEVFCLKMQLKKEILFIYWVAGTVLNPSEENKPMFSSLQAQSLWKVILNILFTHLFTYMAYYFDYWTMNLGIVNLLKSLISTSTYFPKHLL